MIFGRRVRFALIILASQLLLIALAVTWVIQMILIAINGSVMFVEYNPAILLFEIILSISICIFAILVFISQWKRLGEKRRNDDRAPRVSVEKHLKDDPAPPVLLETKRLKDDDAAPVPLKQPVR